MSRCPPSPLPAYKAKSRDAQFYSNARSYFASVFWNQLKNMNSLWNQSLNHFNKSKRFSNNFRSLVSFFFFFLKWAEKFCILCLLSDSQAFKFFAYGLFFWCWKTFSYLNMKFFLKALVQCWHVEISTGYLSTVHKLF